MKKTISLSLITALSLCSTVFANNTTTTAPLPQCLNIIHSQHYWAPSIKYCQYSSTMNQIYTKQNKLTHQWNLTINMLPDNPSASCPVIKHVTVHNISCVEQNGVYRLTSKDHLSNMFNSYLDKNDSSLHLYINNKNMQIMGHLMG